MGCNCKTNRDLAYLRKYYGSTERAVDTSEEVGFTVKEIVVRILAFFALIISIPFLIIFLIISALRGKTINIGNLVGLKNVRKQQNI